MYPVSASQIDTFKDCPRKWAWRYIAGIKSPPNASAELGSEVHSIAERYQLEGASPDTLTKAGAMFVSGLPFMPPPGSGQVEGGIDIVLDGVRYIGFVDFRGKNLPGYDPDRRVVRDYKTSSSPDRYGLWTHEDFLNNTQAVLYGTYDVIEADDSEAHLDWLYFWSKGKERAKPSRTILTRTELEDVFEPLVHNSAREIIRLKTLAPDPLELDPNPAACNKYGGCPHRAICNLTPMQQLRGAAKIASTNNKENGIMGLLDDIKAKRTATATAIAAPETAAPAKEDRINPPEARAEAKVDERALTKLSVVPRAEKAAPAAEFAGREVAVARVLRAIADLLDG